MLSHAQMWFHSGTVWKQNGFGWDKQINKWNSGLLESDKPVLSGVVLKKTCLKMQHLAVVLLLVQNFLFGAPKK